MRNLTPILAALMMVGGMATTAFSEPVTLRVGYAFAYRDAAYRQGVADEFMRRHPDIQIKLESNAPGCPELLEQTLRSAVTGDLPDVLESVCYPHMRTLANRGILSPIDNFISSDTTWQGVGISSAALNSTMYNGSVIGVPEAISTLIVYYNMDLVLKARPDIQELPTTWDSILKLAQDVGQTDKDAMPISFEYYPDAMNWSFNALVYSFGGNVFDANGKIAFDSQAGMKALEILQRVGEAGMIDVTADQARQSFASGKSGIYVGSSSLLNIFTTGAKDKFEMRTVQFPQPTPGGKIPSGGFGIVMITKDPEKQKAAWEFMKFAVGPEAQTIMVTKTGFTPVNEKATSSNEFLGEFYKTRPNYKVAVDELPRIKAMNTYPVDNEPRITTAIRDHLQSVVTLKRSPSEVMPEMVGAVSRLLPKT
ncbi:ABC transporter substrate-binding protein [Mesorhizobium sp. B4-1-4]|uniref:ABC transporter substrate-binding protein n=1 Tax=Mesorhizobium sp. B4-1-4 TaxID=2589888 RepID=UPI00112C09A9|nr:ABC transporter substrate-binding protein [Mesorhizobium sp. B4-1-4]UCI31745.1 ABC transporter substrate-binding protein [Mesorhizobium sp. B4-1-4]